jgi:hypothetical protein
LLHATNSSSSVRPRAIVLVKLHLTLGRRGEKPSREFLCIPR